MIYILTTSLRFPAQGMQKRGNDQKFTTDMCQKRRGIANK